MPKLQCFDWLVTSFFLPATFVSFSSYLEQVIYINLSLMGTKGSRQKKNSVERDNVPFSKNSVGPPLPPLERDTFPRPQNSFQLKTGNVASQELMA